MAFDLVNLRDTALDFLKAPSAQKTTDAARQPAASAPVVQDEPGQETVGSASAPQSGQPPKKPATGGASGNGDDTGDTGESKGDSLDQVAKWVAGGFVLASGLLAGLGIKDDRLTRILRNEPRGALFVFVMIGLGVVGGVVAPAISKTIRVRPPLRSRPSFW